VQLRDVLEPVPDLRIVWVMAGNQINERSRCLIDEAGLQKRIIFASDPESRLIQKLGILKPDPEPMEAGVPHPATYILDRKGVIRFIDIRTDFQIWIEPGVLAEKIASLP
jgi:peroxiredoxin